MTAEIGGTVSVVDTARHEVTQTIDLGPGAKPVGIVVSPDGARIWVANGSADAVVAIDAGTRRPQATIPVGKRPWGLGLAPDGRRLYAANGQSDDVSVIDTATAQVVATVPVGAGPWGVATTGPAGVPGSHTATDK